MTQSLTIVVVVVELVFQFATTFIFWLVTLGQAFKFQFHNRILHSCHLVIVDVREVFFHINGLVHCLQKMIHRS